MATRGREESRKVRYLKGIAAGKVGYHAGPSVSQTLTTTTRVRLLISVRCANVHKVPLSSAVFLNESSGPLLANTAIVVRP